MRCAETELAPDAAATQACGRWLGARLRPGDVLAVVGDLGAGKTTLARGVGQGLGLDDPDAVSSPTYLLVVEHPGPIPLLHADAYLPGKLAAFLLDGGMDYLAHPAAVALVEWGDRLRNMLPDNVLWVTIEAGEGAGRRLSLRCAAASAFPWLSDLPKMFAAH